MFGTGGSAWIAKTLGEGRREKANELFSLLIYVSIVCGVVLLVLGFLFIRPIAAFLGAEGQMLKDCVVYGRVCLLAVPAYILQFEFQCLFATAGKPKLGLYVTLLAGCTNAVLDAVFVAAFRWGLPGAAGATAIGQCGVFGCVSWLFRGRGSSYQLPQRRKELWRVKRAAKKKSCYCYCVCGRNVNYGPCSGEAAFCYVCGI